MLVRVSQRFYTPIKSEVMPLVSHECQQQLVLPHVVFSTLFHSYPDEFQRKMAGSPGEMQQFWEDMQPHPNYGACVGGTHWQDRTIPIALHGDGTPVSGIGKTWCRMMDIYSWTSLLAAGSTLDFTILIYAVFTALMRSDTMDNAWRLICWSFKALATGLWPEEDAFGRKFTEFAPDSIDAMRAGSKLADGFRAVIFVVRGDLDYYSKNLRLRHHASNRPCSWCPCNSISGDPMHWAEFRRDVRQWSSEVWTGPEWIDSHPSRHMLFSILDLTVCHVYVDWMHTKHLGCDAFLYGSILWLLVYKLLPGVRARSHMQQGFGFVIGPLR